MEGHVGALVIPASFGRFHFETNDLVGGGTHGIKGLLPLIGRRLDLQARVVSQMRADTSLIKPKRGRTYKIMPKEKRQKSSFSRGVWPNDADSEKVQRRNGWWKGERQKRGGKDAGQNIASGGPLLGSLLKKRGGGLRNAKRRQSHPARKKSKQCGENQPSFLAI